jgi:hypothetical protein
MIDDDRGDVDENHCNNFFVDFPGGSLYWSWLRTSIYYSVCCD